MFRTISLVQCADHSQANAIVEAARQICGRDPNVGRVEVSVGLRLLDHPLAPQASYSILMDFQDEDAWRRYRAGEAHDEFQALVIPHVTTVLTTQYEFNPLS